MQPESGGAHYGHSASTGNRLVQLRRSQGLLNKTAVMLTCWVVLFLMAGCTETGDVLQITGAEPSFSVSSVSPESASVAVGKTIQLAALNPGGKKRRKARWSSSNSQVASVSSSGLVSGVAEGTATITAKSGRRSSTAVITVTGADGAEAPSPSEPPGEDDIVVSGFTTKAVQDALGEVAAAGGGTVRFPAGTYDLRDWPSTGVQVNVPITLVGEGNAVLQGAGSAHLFDFGKQVHVENLEFRNWLRPIRFWRVGEWHNFEDAAYVRVTKSRFYDVAIAIDGRREKGTPPGGTVHKIGLVSVTDSRFERARRVVDFRRIFIERFAFERNQVREVIHRDGEPDVPGTILSALYVGSNSEDVAQRATEVLIRHNDIRGMRNEDLQYGRAYTILAYRGPTIVEHNHIEDVVSGEDSQDGAAAIYQRSHTYARFANNRVVNGTNTTNVAAIFSKQRGARFEVLNNEIIFTEDFKKLHNSPEYGAFEGTVSDLRFEGNTVRGATRLFVTRAQSSHYGLPKTRQIVRNNTFEECQPRPNTSNQRIFTLGYRRSLVEVSGNRFIDCSRDGSEFIFISSFDNFEETDELRIRDNQWLHTVSGLVVPSQVIRFNAYPRRALITENRYEYLPRNPDGVPTPITFVMLPGSRDGEAGARVTVADNRLEGLRNGTSASITVLDSRAALQELLVERNRVASGGNFVRISNSAPERTAVRDNDATGIKGKLVLKEADGGELIVSGNSN
jgi:hypothetical protein